MHVISISLKDFRNLEDITLTFDAGVNIFTGPNGSGKTNLLEAIATLCLGRSQRQNASDQALINSASDSYRLTGEISTEQRVCTLAVAFQAGRGKKITLDEQPAKVSALFREFAVVSLLPEDSAIIFGPPAVRRNFLDLHLSQASASYLDDLSHYHRTLTQRNSHLKQFGIDDHGTPFDEQLIDYGSRITHTRALFLDIIAKSGGSIYQILAPDSILHCEYFSSALLSSIDRRNHSSGYVGAEISGTTTNFVKMDIDHIKNSYIDRLDRRRSQEAMRETTLVGPHRDDFDMTIDNLPARTHSSQGEWRCAAIALKLAAFGYLKEKYGSAPLLLLDEVFAELDEDRQRALVGAFGDYKQLFLTTALSPPQSLADKAAIFHVSHGRVCRQ
ncbi:MAG: DNA replication/repair protein RecF [candidate division Zixibacteria bacterium]|nr:DNA replication/repair protein RecF [candidate division Zixibacteria bacterium]